MMMPRDPLHRLLLVNCAAGTCLALVFVSALFALNVAGLGDLLKRDEQPFQVIGIMTFGFVITFSSLMMGSAVMMQHDKDDGDGESGTGTAVRNPLRPAYAKVRRPR